MDKEPIDWSTVKEGDSVHYTPGHGPKENGIVKEIRETVVFVVYKCGGDWDNYRKYTGAATNKKDLSPGWVE